MSCWIWNKPYEFIYNYKRFAQYLLKNVENIKERGIIIAYDWRHNSYKFGMESAKVMVTHGVKAHVFELLRAIPELSFAVHNLEVARGIETVISEIGDGYIERIK